MEAELRTPPHSLDAECTVLGTFYLNDGAIGDVATMLTPEDFYSPRNQEIFRTMLDLAKADKAIDPLTVLDLLQRRGTAEKCGGVAYVAGLEQYVINPSRVLDHARIVLDKALTRQVIAAGGKAAENAYSERREPAELAKDLLVAGETVSKRIAGGSTTYAPAEVATDALEWVSAVQDGTKRGVLTGFPAWDLAANGMQDGELVLLASRPSVGKTSLALDVTRRALLDGVGVLFFSYEMDRVQLQLRMISAHSGLPLWKMRREKGLNAGERETFTEAEKRFAELPFHVNEGPGTPEDLHEAVTHSIAKHKDIRLVVVDYIQLMDTRVKEWGANRQQVVASISRSLKRIATEFHRPVLAISQLSRSAEQEKREPRLADLRDSGCLEQDADVVLFLHRQEKPSTENNWIGKIDLLIAKNRQGPLTRIGLKFYAPRTTFEQAAAGEWWRGRDKAEKADADDLPF